MCQTAPYRIFALAFLLAISHAALAGHEAAHVNRAPGHCELCVSQAQPLTGALPADHFDFAVLPKDAAPFLPDCYQVLLEPRQPWRQRAPPEFV